MVKHAGIHRVKIWPFVQLEEISIEYDCHGIPLYRMAWYRREISQVRPKSV